ncbi:MAG TPA: phosphopantetheine-binding protein [Prosthecobacter sp.]|nr:phosphopantetheine-binding protein [Prosthecobacter sp.]
MIHDNPLHARMDALLRPFLRLLPASAPLPLDADLGALGLDSLQSIDLLVALEQEFEIQIPDEKITAESFSTPRHLLELVRPTG